MGKQVRSWRITHLAAWGLCAATLLLLLAGALVTSTGSGLAVPDWPLSYGSLFPPMTGGILFEHGHRLIASMVGLLTFFLAVWLWVVYRSEASKRLAWLGLFMSGLIIFQGLLGGITVLLQLPVAVSVAHALTAQVFFLSSVLLVEWSRPLVLKRMEVGSPAVEPHDGLSKLRLWASILWMVVWLEILLGAVMRHLGVGLIIPDFPLAYGRLLPLQVWQSWPVALHYGHRLGAVLVLLLTVWTASRILWGSSLKIAAGASFEKMELQRPAWGMLILTAVQISLGAAIIWLQREVVVTSLHLVNGALLNAAVFILWKRSRR